MIVFLLLGFVAGVMHVLRAAGEISGPIGSDNNAQNDGNDEKE